MNTHRDNNKNTHVHTYTYTQRERHTHTRNTHAQHTHLFCSRVSFRRFPLYSKRWSPITDPNRHHCAPRTCRRPCWLGTIRRRICCVTFGSSVTVNDSISTGSVCAVEETKKNVSHTHTHIHTHTHTQHTHTQHTHTQHTHNTHTHNTHNTHTTHTHTTHTQHTHNTHNTHTTHTQHTHNTHNTHTHNTHNTHTHTRCWTEQERCEWETERERERSYCWSCWGVMCVVEVVSPRKRARDSQTER